MTRAWTRFRNSRGCWANWRSAPRSIRMKTSASKERRRLRARRSCGSTSRGIRVIASMRVPFSRPDGVLPGLARYYYPDLVGFGDHYPPMIGLTWDGRALDRRLLVDLEKAVWDSVAGALQGRLADSVIDAAVGWLPTEYYARDGARLARALKRRRDLLRTASDRFYALLAGTVDVQATDEADVAAVERRGDGAMAVQLSRPDGTPYFVRTFRREETREVRLYLHGGDDRVVVRGAGHGGITVRVITGAGKNEVVDSARGWGRNYFYMDHPPARLITGPRTSVDRGAARDGPRDDPTKRQLRDWGARGNRRDRHPVRFPPGSVPVANRFQRGLRDRGATLPRRAERRFSRRRVGLGR